MKNIWPNIKLFFCMGLALFGAVGVMFGMGIGPTVNPRIISVLLETASGLLGLIAVFLFFTQNYANEREEKIETLNHALRDLQMQFKALKVEFQETISSLNKGVRMWEKRFEELNLPTPTEDEIRQAMQNFDTPPPEKKMWEKIKAFPLLLKKLP
jgi:propanediol dehydratase large subunit